jgi:hypothetical protein
MGDPTDTVTTMMERFEARYRGFKDELPSRQARGAFERIRRVARKHSTALNRFPDIDFERPLLLTVVLDQQVQIDNLDRELARTRNLLYAVTQFIEDHHGIQLPPVRGARPVGSELDRLGQARLEDHPDAAPVPA